MNFDTIRFNLIPTFSHSLSVFLYFWSLGVSSKLVSFDNGEAHKKVNPNRQFVFKATPKNKLYWILKRLFLIDIVQQFSLHEKPLLFFTVHIFCLHSTHKLLSYLRLRTFFDYLIMGFNYLNQDWNFQMENSE